MTNHSRRGRLLLFAPVPLYGTAEDWLVELQAANGMRLWAEHFEHVTIMMPHQTGPAPEGWGSISTVGPNRSRIQIVPLPTAWELVKFAKAYRTTRKVIRSEISKADYLSFSIGGLVGDWGSVACLQAHQMGRKFAVWTDRVESEVIRIGAKSGRLKRRLKNSLIHRPMAKYERFIIRRAALGLFHGKQTFDIYAPYCRNPQIVHDIHVSRDKHIDDAQFETKLESARHDPLRIVYAGRIAAMKGPQDWARSLSKLKAAGIPFEARWLGDGPLMDVLSKDLAAQGLTENVVLEGFVDDAEVVAERMRAAHIFLFCHTTPESPRCLIESLIAGTPIVGYDSAYAADLISTAGGGQLVPIGQTEELGEALIGLSQNRDSLLDLTRKARKDSAPFDDESVFAHRSELIKTNL